MDVMFKTKCSAGTNTGGSLKPCMKTGNEKKNGFVLCKYASTTSAPLKVSVCFRQVAMATAWACVFVSLAGIISSSAQKGVNMHSVMTFI